jgi:4-hydroxy-tetrahydrodipicolinate reductase
MRVKRQASIPLETAETTPNELTLAMKNSPVRVLLIGAAGRMGKTVLELSGNDPDVEITGQCDLGDSMEQAMKNCEVAIDFSHADAVNEICRSALQHGKSLVIGTTGHSQQQRTTIEETARSLPIVFASNFSIGVNVLFWLSGKAAELLGPDFNPEIVEMHHTMKKDAPSGTAKTLAEVLKAVRNSEIPIQSIREGDVIGEHNVIFSGPGERLELTHRAAGREIFARGALRAAKWIADKRPGLYSMRNVLGL